MSTKDSAKLSTFSTLSIGIGGMVGGGIFAVTGMVVEMTKGGAPIAFLIAGIVALLTSYSYLKLTLRYPGEGGTVQFLNQAFGTGIFTGAANILLLLSYVVLVAVYAFAFGDYGAGFFPAGDHDFWSHVLSSGVIIALAALAIFGGKLLIRAQDIFNLVKLTLLAVFVIFGLFAPMEWVQLSPSTYPSAMGLVAAAMLIFLNYEGFELIATASNDVADPQRSLPVAYIGGVLIAITLYVLVCIVVIGQLSPAEAAAGSVHTLSIAAEKFMGRAGFIAIGVAALMATSSAITATLGSTGRLAYIIAKTGELPSELTRSVRGQHFEGTLITAALALIVANFVPLEAIATMGSAGFLLIFMAVNIANVRLGKETGSRVWLSALAALSTFVALVVLCVEVDENPATRHHLWILIGMITASFLIEFVYRGVTQRKIRLGAKA